MKKILLLSLLLTVSSCSFPGMNKEEITFSSLYNKSIHSSVESLEKFGQALGVNRHETVEGNIVSNLSVPGLFSWSLTSNYNGLIDGRNSESVFQNLQVLFNSLISSGSLSVEQVSVLSHGTDSFLSFKNISDVGVIPEPVRAIIKKYENTWLNIAQNNVEDMSSEELLGYNIGKNLFSKSLTDLEKYATDYALLKDTQDLGMSGSLHFWSVELDRTNIIKLAQQLTKDLAGTGITDETLKSMSSALESVAFSGKIGFDPEKPSVSLLEWDLTASGKLIANIVISHQENNSSIQINNSEEKTAITVNYGKVEDKYTFDAKITKDNIEMWKLNAYVSKKEGKFHELSIEASAQWMTISLKHTMEGDKFVGKLSAVVATLDWSGTIIDGRLEWFKINGTSPVGTLSVDLTKSNDGSIKWPVLLKNGTEVLASMNLGLEIAREKFAIIVDLVSEDMPAHFDMMVTAKTTPSTKKVIIPQSSKSFQDMIDEINALVPEAAPIQELNTSDMMDASSLDTTSSTSMDSTLN